MFSNDNVVPISALFAQKFDAVCRRNTEIIPCMYIYRDSGCKIYLPQLFLTFYSAWGPVFEAKTISRLSSRIQEIF